MRIKNEEEHLQQSCITWFNYQYPKYSKCLFHVQQKAKNSIEGAKFKKNGVVSGVSDLILIAPKGITYFIELKTAKGKQSDEQKQFEIQVLALSHNYTIVRSLDEFIQFVKQALSSK